MKKLLISIAILLFWASFGWAAVVYFKNISGTPYYETGASSCDDVTAADTQGDMEAAENAASAGELYICNDEEYEYDDVDSNGALNAAATLYFERGSVIRGRIHIEADKSPQIFGSGAAPIISGCDYSTTYGLESGTVYSKAGITTEPKIVLYNGSPLYRITYKLAFDSGSVEPTIGEKVEEAVGTAEGIIVSYTLSSGSWVGGDAAGYLNIGARYGDFTNNEAINGSQSGDDFMTADGDWAAMTSDLDEGQFSWNSDTLYVNVGEDPDNGTLEIAQRDRCFSITDRDSVTIDGFDLRNSNSYAIVLGTSTNTTISNNTFTRHPDYGLVPDSDNSGTVIESNTFVDCRYAVRITNASETATDCDIIDNTFSNSAFWHVFTRYSSSVSINKASTVEVYRNRISNINGEGVLLTDSDSNKIHNNLILYTGDGIAIESSDSNEIYNNTIFGVTTLRLSGDGDYPRIKLGDNFGAGSSSDSNLIKNNILVTTLCDGDCYCIAANTAGTSNSIDYNHYYQMDDVDAVFWNEGGGNWAGTLTEFKAAFSNKYEQNSPAEINPLLTSSYKLKFGSPAINAGFLWQTEGWQDKGGWGMLCNEPDIGAYEYRGSDDFPIFPIAFSGGCQGGDWYAAETYYVTDSGGEEYQVTDNGGEGYTLN